MNNDWGIGLGFLVGILVVCLVVGLLVAALVLRASVWLTNKTLGGPVPAVESAGDELDGDEFDYDPGLGQSRRGPRTRVRRGGLIPVPGIGRGLLVALAGGFAGLLLQTLVYAVPAGIALGGGDAGLVMVAYVVMALVSVPLAFLAHAWVLAVMLPTSFGRGCLVVLFNYIVLVAVAVALLAVTSAAGFLFGPGR